MCYALVLGVAIGQKSGVKIDVENQSTRRCWFVACVFERVHATWDVKLFYLQAQAPFRVFHIGFR